MRATGGDFPPISIRTASPLHLLRLHPAYHRHLRSDFREVEGTAVLGTTGPGGSSLDGARLRLRRLKRLKCLGGRASSFWQLRLRKRASEGTGPSASEPSASLCLSPFLCPSPCPSLSPSSPFPCPHLRCTDGRAASNFDLPKNSCLRASWADSRMPEEKLRGG